MEDYLEAISHIIKEKQVARVKDISKRLKVNMSSVSGALHTLAKKKLINYAPYEIVTLTPKGNTIAEDIILRHQTLKNFFMNVLSIDEKLADETACKMEHSITNKILRRFNKFIMFFENCPRGGAKWIKGSGYYC
jgi:DtxR family Mn-dependent transcriptional regulator